MRRVFGRVWRKCFPGSKGEQAGTCTKVLLLTEPRTLGLGGVWPAGGVCPLQNEEQTPLEKALAREQKTVDLCTWENVCPFKVKEILGRIELGHRSRC